MQPLPPSPALTRILASSTNMKMLLFAIRFSLNSGDPNQSIAVKPLRHRA
jgi:hypothetical protein